MPGTRSRPTVVTCWICALIAMLIASVASVRGLFGEDLATPAVTVEPLDPEQSLYAKTLTAVVKSDGVDYAALRRDHVALDRYRAQLAKLRLPDQPSGRKALLINAYNAWTLALVAQLLPADATKWPEWSIKDGGGLLTSVWKKYTFELGGTRYTLDQIENQLLRPLGDPRIHFAINCASRSCPAIAGTPYLAATVDQQLDAAARAFAASAYHLRLSADGKELLANPILDWFGGDFGKAGGVRAFLAAHAPDGAVKSFLLAPGGTLGFFAYDWRLNLAGAQP